MRLSGFLQVFQHSVARGTEHPCSIRSNHIDPNNDEDKTRYTEDGLHFNDDGHAFIARALGDFLTEL